MGARRVCGTARVGIVRVELVSDHVMRHQRGWNVGGVASAPCCRVVDMCSFLICRVRMGRCLGVKFG